MLYVFHVDTGTMMTFDMNLALERVSSLQTAITKGCHIPEDKQVLLISGGESLDPNAVVGKYHAGTDTNPIFLFSKCTIESSIPPSPSVNYGSDLDLQGQLEGSLLMPPAYETVVSRAQLALQFHEVDTEELRACEKLIHDQHLQQQGWAAVVANLEDVTSDILHQSETFHVTFQDYLESRDSYRELIASVSGSLQLLSKIPLILALAKSFDATTSTSSNENLSSTTLFDWISSQDTNHTLHDMVEQCDKATEQLDVKVEEYLKSEIEQILKEVQNESMKEVKGLEDRLYGLDQIIAGAKKLVQEQADLAQGFVQNQNRFSDIRDRSVLPDLCASHRNQLVEMLKNHNRLREIKKKCRLAKEELSVNLHTRLRWVMYVEKKILDVDGKLTIYLGNIRRIKKRLDILQQIKDAPRVYAQLLVEVVRRRNFSCKFLMWAGGIAENSGRLYTEEVKRRDTFLRIIGQHFLQSMFSGLEDCPPAFATEPPDLFDNNLPNVSAEDIKQLQAAIPELSGILSVPTDDDLFATRSVITDPKVLSTTAPGVGSEIEVLDERAHRYSIEGGSISLGDQFTACEKDADIVQRPMSSSTTSPPDNFLLAKSLSAELTMDMNNVKKNINDVSETKMKAQRLQTTSTSISAIKHLMVSRASKMSPPSITETCYSPDMDTSQEFATADFYFDESMPSSIESPPKRSTETKAKFEDKFLAEKESNAKLQRELQDCSYKINHYEKILKCFKGLFDNTLPDLKNIANELKSEHCDHINVLMNELESLRENMKGYLHSYDANASRSYGSIIDQMNAEREKQIQELNNKIAAESSKLQEFEEKVKLMSKELEERDKNCQKDIEKIMREKDDLGAKLAVEVADLTLKHELEIEVEVDKLKSEYLTKMTDFEKDLECKDKLMSKMDHAIKQLQKEKIQTEEELMDKFQKEKDKICDILNDEFNEKLQKAVKEEQNKTEFMKQSIITEINEEHQKTQQKQLEELKQSLFIEKEQVVHYSESTLTLAYSKFAEEIKQRLLDEKSVEFRKLKEELENKFQADLANSSKEFGEEIKRLVAELKTFKDRRFTCSEMQTQQSIYNMIDDGIQVCSNFIMVDAQVDTEILLHTSTSMQTEFHNCISFAAVQTDVLPVNSCSIQTGNGHMTMDHSLQTNDIHVCDLSIQTESAVSMSIQTETDETELLHVSLSEIGVQTDQWEVYLNSMTTSYGLDTEANLKLCLDFDKKTKDLVDKHNQVISELTSQLDREKEESQQLKSSLTSLAGGKQIKFNEAVNKVCKEKDKCIDDLKLKEKELTAQLSMLKDQVENIKAEKSQAEDAVGREKSNFEVSVKVFTTRQHQLENDLGLAQQQLKQYRDKLQLLTPEVRDSSSSTSFVEICDAEDSRLHKRINDLENALKTKDEELCQMQQKMTDLSMSASTRSLIQDKVSITSCHVGDLVLLCLDERLDQYVVFTVGNTLHILHTDCLVPLGLNPEVGKAKRQWLIAEVIDKEYCQAKKASNRFNVPMGTRFYRVRAKKWNRENNPPAVKLSDTASSKVDTGQAS